MQTEFEIKRVSVLAWQAAGIEDLPDYEALACSGHDLAISIAMMLGIVTPDSWDALPQEVKTPLTVFAQRIVEERLGMSEFHDLLCESLIAQGYRHGMQDSEEDHTASVLVPYGDLPPYIRITDACFEAGVLWMMKERYPAMFDLMPSQNNEWVAYQTLAFGPEPGASQGH